MQRRKDSSGRVLKDGESERNDRYQYRYTVNGKRKYIYAKTLKELRELEKKIPAEKDFCDLTVDDVYELYIDMKEKTLRRTTVDMYKYYYERYLKSYFGKKLISEVKRSEIKRFMINDKRALHNKSILLYGIFDYALDCDFIQNNPCKNSNKGIKLEPKKPKALTVEETKLLLKKAKEYYPDTYYPLFTFMLETGVRIGEAMGLRKSNINFKEKYITIEGTLIRVNGVTTINKPKTKNSLRKIPLTSKALAILKKNKAVKCTETISGFNDFVFVNEEGRLFSNPGTNIALNRICRNTPELPHISCHTLRHTFCSRLCEANINIKVIQQLMGHNNISTTMDIYTDVTKDFTLEEFRKFHT